MGGFTRFWPFPFYEDTIYTNCWVIAPYLLPEDLRRQWPSTRDLPLIVTAVTEDVEVSIILFMLLCVTLACCNIEQN